MLRKIVLTLVCVTLALAFSSTRSWAVELTGKWEASIFGHRFTAQTQQKGQKLSGVAYLYDFFGNRSTYHFRGMVNGNKVVASHHDGHVFNGDVTPDGRLVGTLRTSNGHKIPIDVKGAGR